jgi:uncharacterized protein (TIGR00299 family) protein
MKKALLIDPFSGASGDMLLAALVGLGVSCDALGRALAGVPELAQVKLEKRQVRRGMFGAVQIGMSFPEEPSHRHLKKILEIIDRTEFDGRVKDSAGRTFQRLAEAEAKVHGSTIEDVHFHEVGAVDAIVDILGFYAALDLLNVGSCYYTRLVFGSGTVQCAHGQIPVPVPATVELLTGHEVAFSNREGELITPTGAALIATAFEPLPADRHIRMDKVAYGAGSRETEGLPNVLRAVLGEVVESPRQVAIITCTIDDMNPELYGFLMDKLFTQGALEVYYSSVMMKKNRPGLEVTVITELAVCDSICQFILAETTTLGLRLSREERIELDRRKVRLDTPYGKVELKIGRLPDGREKVSPEYESCRAAAESSGASLLEVFEAARLAWERGKQ